MWDNYQTSVQWKVSREGGLDVIAWLQKKYALSEQGAKDLVKGCIACVLQNLSFLFPVGLLYQLVCDLLSGGAGRKGRFLHRRLRGLRGADSA